MICVGGKSRELPPGGMNDPDEDLGREKGTALTCTGQESNGFLELSFRYHFWGLTRAGLDDLMWLFCSHLLFKHVLA